MQYSIAFVSVLFLFLGNTNSDGHVLPASPGGRANQDIGYKCSAVDSLCEQMVGPLVDEWNKVKRHWDNPNQNDNALKALGQYYHCYFDDPNQTDSHGNNHYERPGNDDQARQTLKAGTNSANGTLYDGCYGMKGKEGFWLEVAKTSAQESNQRERCILICRKGIRWIRDAYGKEKDGQDELRSILAPIIGKAKPFGVTDSNTISKVQDVGTIYRVCKWFGHDTQTMNAFRGLYRDDRGKFVEVIVSGIDDHDPIR